jgi:hypothetical protein
MQRRGTVSSYETHLPILAFPDADPLIPSNHWIIHYSEFSLALTGVHQFDKALPRHWDPCDCDIINFR